MAKIIGAPTLDDALAALVQAVAVNEEHSERSLIFCEDRLTLLAERAVLSACGGTFSTEVTTFARFLSGEARVLSKQGSVMELAALLEECEGELVCFRRGAARAVYETIAQLSASRVDPDMLRAAAEETEGYTRGKLLDLSLLFDKYRNFLREKGMVDENGYLALLPEKLRSGNLGDVHLFFFAFSSFTKQAAEGVKAALSCARDVTGIFLAGNSGLYTNESARVFRRLCEEEGDAQAVMKKCSLSEDALALQRGLFSPERLSEPPRRTQKIRRFTASDPEEELKIVAALIKKSVFEGKRYREIAVLVPSAEEFSTVEKVFSAFRIPFFADRKRPFSEHPFCAFVLDVLGAVSDGVLPEEADAIAASAYFGNGDNYRNYLLKFGGYRGAVRREIKEGDAVKGYSRRELSDCRERMLSILSLFPRKGRGSEFVQGVREIYSLTEGEKVTRSLSDRFTGADREFLDISPLEGALAEIETVAGERVFTAREFCDMLKSGLETLEIAMIPQSADAVFVGDATDSRLARVAVLFATGLTDALPRSGTDTAVISDDEIARLTELRLEIEPAIAVVNARARESLALNLCAFEEALYLSYPLSSGGEEVSRGEVLEYAERLFSMPPMPELFPFDCCERQPAILTLLSLRNAIEGGRERDKEEYSSLFAALGAAGEDAEALLSDRDKKKVREAGELYFSGSVSPTLLEKYFSCPYAGFATQALKLREREERAVQETDAGTFVHAVLQKTAQRFNELTTEEECGRAAREIGKELLVSPKYAALSDTKAGEYTGERLLSEGEAVSVAAYRQLVGSAFRVRSVEERLSLPSLSLRGIADRVDSSDRFVRVVDYKTGLIDDSPTAYYTGRKLQLELYLLAAAGEGTPAGAFYFPAADVFSDPDRERFRMKGFFNAEREVLERLDPALKEKDKSDFFEGRSDGRALDKGMSGEDFEAFLGYSLLVSQRAENEMKEGNIAPSPYLGACEWCKLKSLCGFTGVPRKESGVKCAEIAGLVRRERGEK